MTTTVTEVPLTRGLVALVDASDYELVVSQGKWHATQPYPDLHYARRTIRLGDGRNCSILLHSFLSGWRYVDHIDGNGLNNTRTNLRQATHAQNMGNRRLQRNNTTGFKGIWHAPHGKWRAQISVNGRRVAIGYFPTAEEAARAYDRAALDAFGEFARTNFPRGEYQ